MIEKVYITEMGLAGSFNEFKEAILVKVIPVDFLDYYRNNKFDEDYEETLQQTEKWLMFNRYPEKDQWLIDKKENCDCGFYWEIDLDNFICRSTYITDHKTGEGFIRPIYQVIMTNYNIDAVEANEIGAFSTGRTGIQRSLDELNLTLIGANDSLYYLLTDIQSDNSTYAIPYNLVGDVGGLMRVDKIIVQKNSSGKNGYVVISAKTNYGVYNPLTREIFKFVE